MATITLRPSSSSVRPETCDASLVGRRLSSLGDRIMAWVKATLAERSEFLGADTVKHDVTIVDPLEVFGANGALSGWIYRQVGCVASCVLRCS